MRFPSMFFFHNILKLEAGSSITGISNLNYTKQRHEKTLFVLIYGMTKSAYFYALCCFRKSYLIFFKLPALESFGFPILFFNIGWSIGYTWFLSNRYQIRKLDVVGDHIIGFFYAQRLSVSGCDYS